jgi:hypothetical protein
MDLERSFFLEFIYSVILLWHESAHERRYLKLKILRFFSGFKKLQMFLSGFKHKFSGLVMFFSGFKTCSQDFSCSSQF